MSGTVGQSQDSAMVSIIWAIYFFLLGIMRGIIVRIKVFEFLHVGYEFH